MQGHAKWGILVHVDICELLREGREFVCLYYRDRESEFVLMYLCYREGETERESIYVCVCLLAYLCYRERESVCVCVDIPVLQREREKARESVWERGGMCLY